MFARWILGRTATEWWIYSIVPLAEFLPITFTGTKNYPVSLQQGPAALARGPFVAPETPKNGPRTQDHGAGNSPGNRVKPESKTRNFINNLWSQQRFLIPYKNMTER